MSGQGNTNEREIVLSCAHLWKVFGYTGPNIEGADENKINSLIEKANCVKAVANVSLDVHKGEVVVLMGLSGSGKSTLLRCLSRLITPSAGKLSFDGEDLLAMDDHRLRQVRREKIGMVFQSFALLPNRTVLGNIELPLEIKGVGKKEREAKALEITSLVGLKGRENYYPSELSGGQQQRVGIGRSLASDPEVWFLDEPFSALDPLIRRELQDELIRLQKSLRKTIVFVTHDFAEAVKISNRIALMKDGSIVQCGTAEELLFAPANDYVRAFVSDVDWARVVTIEDIMEAPEAGTENLEKLPAKSTLRDVAKMFDPNGSTWAVCDDDGKVIGVLDAKGFSRGLADAAAQVPPLRYRGAHVS